MGKDLRKLRAASVAPDGMEYLGKIVERFPTLKPLDSSVTVSLHNDSCSLTAVIDKTEQRNPFAQNPRFGQRKANPSRKSAVKAERKQMVNEFNLRLSQLMSYGSRGTKFLDGWMNVPDSEEDSEHGRIEACALGASYYAHVMLTVPKDKRAQALVSFESRSESDTGFSGFKSQFPVLNHMPERGCPVPGCERRVCREDFDAGEVGDTSVFDLIVHLNDEHDWKRSRTAAWLERQEDEFNGVKTFLYKPLPLPA